MKKIYYLSTCGTCRKILSSFDHQQFELQNIRIDPITKTQLESLKKEVGSYEKLFSKKSNLYKELGLKDVVLKESDFKKYLLQHYTFLKRPVIIDGSTIFIGSEKSTMDQIAAHFKTSKKKK